MNKSWCKYNQDEKTGIIWILEGYTDEIGFVILKQMNDKEEIIAIFRITSYKGCPL